MRPGLRRYASALLAAALAMSAAAAPASAQMPPHHVLVWDNAKLYARPALDAPFARHYAWDDSAREARLGDVVVMRFVSEEGGFIKLSNAISDAATHCYPSGLAGTEALEVYVYAHKGDVLEATSAPMKRSFPDETSIALPTGVAVVKRPNGNTTFGVDGLIFELPGAVSALTHFRPTPAATRSSGPPHAIGHAAVMRLAGGVVLERRDGRWSAEGVTEVEAEPTAPDHRHLTLVGHCGTYRITTAIDAPIALASVKDPTPSAAPDIPDKGRLAAGTALFYADGRGAGTVKSDIVVGAPRKVGGLHCVAVPLATDPARKDRDPTNAHVELCTSEPPLAVGDAPPPKKD